MSRIDSAMSRIYRGLPDICGVTALIIGIFIAFADVLGSARGLYFRDHHQIFRRRWWYIIEDLRNGILPVGPLASIDGVPLERLLNGTYTPTTIPLLLGDVDQLYDAFIILHFVLLGTGVYVLARSLSAQPMEALFSAALGTLSGPVLSWESLVMSLHGLTYTPWVLWTFRRLVERPSFPWVGVFAVASGFQLQGITPEIALLDLFGGLFILWVLRVWPGRRHFLALVVGVVLAFGIAAIQLAPVLEQLEHTRRGSGFPYEEASAWSFHPEMIADFLAPSFWTPPDLPFVVVGEFNNGRFSSFLPSLYLGWSVLFAFLAIFVPANCRIIWALLALAILFVVIATGPLTPIHGWLHQLPIFRSSRFPIKYLTLATACMIAVMVPVLRAIWRMPRLFVAVLLAYVAALTGLLMITAMPGFERFLMSSMVKELPIPPFAGLTSSSQTGLAVSAMQVRVFHGLAFSSAALLIGIFMTRRPGEQGWHSVALATLVLLDLSFGARYMIFGARTPAYPAPLLELQSGIKDVFRQRVFRLAGGAPQVPARRHPDETYFAAYIREIYARGLVLPVHLRPAENRDFDGMSNELNTMFNRLIDPGVRLGQALLLLARAGTRWIISPFPIADQPPYRTFDIGEGRGYLFEVPRARPYVDSYHRWRTLDLNKLGTRDAVLQIFTEAPVDEALVPVDVSTQPARAKDLTALEDVSTAITENCRGGIVKVAGDAGSGIDIVHSSTCQAVVVVREPFYFGWTASIDNVPQEIFQVEFGFLGILVAPGTHGIHFEYLSSARWWLPVSVSAASLALMLMLAPLLKLWRRSDPCSIADAHTNRRGRSRL